VYYSCPYLETLVLENLESGIVADTFHRSSFGSPSGMCRRHK
jgi:hypothetical protein